MSSTASLSAAADDRKARLAQLKSLKRKQPPTSSELDSEQDKSQEDQQKQPPDAESPTPASASTTYLSGRNYDLETRGPKLGFETAPSEGLETLEAKARILAEATKQQADEEDKADKPLDLFKLQPKKPNWDLKRDLDKKLEILNVRTDNAIARMVRERIQKAQKEAKASGQNGDTAGLDGRELVEAMHMREREEEDDEREDEDEFED